MIITHTTDTIIMRRNMVITHTTGTIIMRRNMIITHTTGTIIIMKANRNIITTMRMRFSLPGDWKHRPYTAGRRLRIF